MRPGDWLDSGCLEAERHGIGSDRVINTRGAGEVTSAARDGAQPGPMAAAARP